MNRILLPRLTRSVLGALVCTPVAFSIARRPAIACAPAPEPIRPRPQPSRVAITELGFGSASGICVGVFIKKGLRTLAFVLGGLFVFLQYLASQEMVSRVDWPSISKRYDSVIDTLAGPPSAQSRLSRIWSRFTDFLLADFPPRATFLAGVALGLRLG